MQIGGTWCSLVQLGADWCNLVQFGATWFSLVQLGADWYNLVQFEGTWCSLVQLGPIGATWRSLVQLSAVCKKLASRIAVLRKIRAFLPLSQRVKYYNVVIRPVMSYASVIWSSCDKEQLYRVLKLQKCTATVILYADRQVSPVALFNKPSWIPFYEQSRLDKCSIIYKGINGTFPIHLNDHINK